MLGCRTEKYKVRRASVPVVRERAATQYFDVLYNQASIAETEKAIPLFHRILVHV